MNMLKLFAFLGVIGPTFTPLDYAATRSVVERGTPVILFVGVSPRPVPQSTIGYTASLEGIKSGVYRCYRDDTGNAVMVPTSLEPQRILPVICIGAT